MKIIPRSGWGARAPRGRAFVDWPDGVDFWLHHTAGPQSQTVRQIQNFHMDTRGWSDVGYSYLVDFDGTVYEGRGLNVHGAHSPGRNHEPAVSLIGTYSTVEPSDAQHRAVYELKEFLRAGRLRGHRENSQTTCPGDAAFAKIVKGPPPGDLAATEFYFFEELPHTEGGTGPKIVGQAAGYAKKAEAYLTVFRQRALGRSVSTVRSGDGEADRIYVLWWAKGTYGKQYRFGPWQDKAARDVRAKTRETNTRRTMRRFESRSRSLYPWADA